MLCLTVSLSTLLVRVGDVKAMSPNDTPHTVAVSPEQLFDIRFGIDSSRISSMRDLQTRVEFTSFGRVPTTVNFHFTITDATGKQVYESQPETVVVETELQYPKRFLDVPELPPGTYMLHLATEYKGDTHDSFMQPFTVVVSSERFVLYGILGIFGTGIGVWMVYLVAHLRHKIPRNRMIAITARTAALMVAGVVLPTAAQLVGLKISAQQDSQANLIGSLASRASVDVGAFIHRAEETKQDFARVSAYASSVTDEEFLSLASTTKTIDAIHIVQPDGTPYHSAFRELGFVLDTPRAVPPVEQGLYQRADGDWRTVATYPRAAGGWYRIEASFTADITDIVRRTRPGENVFFINASGIVLTAADGHPVGTNLFSLFPDMSALVQGHEYYEGISKGSHAFTSRRVLVPTGQGVQWLYVISCGQSFAQFGALVNFAF